MSQDQPQRLSLLRPEPTTPPGSTADELGHRLDELAAELAADHQRMLSVLDQAIRRLAPNPQVDRLASLLDEAIERVNGATGAPSSPPPRASGADAAYASVWGVPADPAPAPVTPSPSAATAGIASPDVTAAPVPPAAPVAPPEPVAPPKPVAPPEPATPPAPVAPLAPAPPPAPVEPPAPAATTVTPRPVWQSNLYAVAAAAIVLVLAILFVNVV